MMNPEQGRPPSLNNIYDTLTPLDLHDNHHKSYLPSPTNIQKPKRNSTLAHSPQRNAGELIMKTDLNSPQVPKEGNKDGEKVKGLNFTPGYGISLDPYVLDQNIKLVPCRWSNSGWKYVEEEPSEQKFFKNPNRVNTMGFPEQISNMRRGSNSVMRHYEKRPDRIAMEGANRFNGKRTSMGRVGAQVTQKLNDPFESSYKAHYNRNR